MKKLFFLLALMMPMMASADEVINGIKYSCSTVGNVNYAQVKGYETGLTIANIPGSITSGGKQYTVASIAQSAFSGCSTLTSVTFPNSLVAIDNLAFSGCTSLTSITIPSGMTESIGYGVFQGCTSLSSIVVNSGNTKYNSGDNCNAIIETSTNKLIAGCRNTTIPTTVRKIGQRAFAALYNLTSIDIPSSVRFIEASAFQETGLTSVDLSNVTSIGDYAFYSCTGLTSVTTKASIGSYAFQGCTGLTSVTMTSGTTIGYDAFYGCNNLTSVTMPNTLTSIGDGAFSGTKVKSVTIPSNVTSIGYMAFLPTGGLTSVTVERTSPCTLTSNPFPSSWNATLYVPKGSKASYEAATYWKDFGTIKVSGLIEQTLSLTSIPTKTYGDAAFSLPATTEEGLTLTWSVANTNVATVSSNVFTIKGAGTTTVTATQAGNDDYEAFSRDYTLTVNPKNASNLTISSISAVTYTGLAKTPSFTVKDGSTTLSSGTHYTVVYSNNINAGTAAVTIMGKGNYTGTKTAYFTINKAPLTITAKSYTINQKDDLPEFEVTYSGFKNSETSSVLTTQPTITCDAADSETAGVFDITPSGAAATNYSFNYVKGTLTIDEVTSVSIAVNSLGKGTYCSEFPLDFTNVSGIKAYIISGFNPSAGNLIITRVYEVPAGTGLFIDGTPGATFNIPVKSTDFYYVNMMKGITVAKVIPTYEDGYTNYILGSDGQGGVIFKRSGGTATTAANRAYVQIPTSMAGARSSLGMEEDGTTGVEGIRTPDTEDSEGDYYNLNGQKVQSLKRGIYIKNGKKIIIH